MSKHTYPQWQTALREAAANLSTPLFIRTAADEATIAARAKEGIDGRNLHFVLKHIFSIPTATPALQRNQYVVDGFHFSIKTTSDDRDEVQPVYSSTSGETKSKQAVTFTLYVSKIIPDPAYANWPTRRVIVGRNLSLQYGNYSRLRAELAGVLDELQAAYDAEVPRYQAWKAVQMTPDEQQDFFMQLIRRALREMPKTEVLPVAIPAADEADARTAIDGMATAKPVTLADVQATASHIIALLDDIIPPDYEDDDDDDDSDDEDFDDEAWDDEDDDNSDDQPIFGDEYDDESTEPDTIVSNRPLTAKEVKTMLAAMDYAAEVTGSR